MNALIQRTTLEGGIALLTLDRPDHLANTLDEATLLALEVELESLAAEEGLRGLILTSAKPAIFVAGADFSFFRTLDSERLARYLALGQRVFNLLAALKLPSVAAIHGACVGGGYELTLACDYRIATPERVTRIGLPETQLGIIPAWGGSTRLPRLVGVPTALEVILKGKRYPAREALRLGLIDELAPRPWLLKAAQRVLRGDRELAPLVKRHELFFQRPVNLAVASTMGGRTKAEVARRTRGHYPAQAKAVELIMEGAGEKDLEPSLQRERVALLHLASGEEVPHLFGAFLLQEKARKLAREEAGEPIRSAAVIGAGVMGAGIAQRLSARGVEVFLYDLDVERVASGMKRIGQLYRKAVERHLMDEREARDGLDRIHPAPGRSGEAALRRVDLVIEAAVEKLEIKREIFRQLDRQTGPQVVLATNTSALPVHLMAEATGRPQKVIGLHFFNPVHSMPLVEVVLPEAVDAATRARAFAVVNQLGKLPLVVADRPGFLVNRLLLPYLLEAAAAFDGGSDVVEIDEAMLRFGMPMGPLRLVDEVGLDVALEVARTLENAFPQRFAIPAFLEAMEREAWNGKKSGAGFYRYDAKREPAPHREIERLRGKGPVVLAEQLEARMLYRMIDEAAFALEERVVASAAEVDFGMMMGAGFPPFRGGLLRYADSLGIARIVQEMEALGMTPGEPLYRRAAENQPFHHENETGA